MSQIPTTEPASVIAGDTVRWAKTLPQYPASAGWSLAYTLLNAAGKITLQAEGDGDVHTVHASPTVTEQWQPGEYTYRARVSNLAGDAFTVGEGRITVRASFSVESMETRSAARVALEAVEAYLRNPQNIKAAQYEIEGRKLERFKLGELWAHRDRLRQEVAREDQADGLSNQLQRGRVYVRFGK